MWDLPGPGLKPMSPALAGGFLTTEPPGKPCTTFKRKKIGIYRTRGSCTGGSKVKRRAPSQEQVGNKCQGPRGPIPGDPCPLSHKYLRAYTCCCSVTVLSPQAEGQSLSRACVPAPTAGKKGHLLNVWRWQRDGPRAWSRYCDEERWQENSRPLILSLSPLCCRESLPNWKVWETLLWGPREWRECKESSRTYTYNSYSNR